MAGCITPPMLGWSPVGLGDLSYPRLAFKRLVNHSGFVLQSRYLASAGSLSKCCALTGAAGCRASSCCGCEKEKKIIITQAELAPSTDSDFSRPSRALRGDDRQ